MVKRRPNALIRAKSPYLLQHAYNPVKWLEWGDEAFRKAKEEEKPIFLSIGYSSCHWCHVMARESFNDEEIAEILNRDFIPVKVDREERPDLDSIYMTAVQLITGRGGWPLSVFLTPDLKPIYGGTYFPPEPRHGLPAFKDVLIEVSRIWRERRDKVIRKSNEVAQILQSTLSARPSDEELSPSVFDDAFGSLVLDYEYGGFSRGPKFPMVATLFFLLRYYLREKKGLALRMVSRTLHSMAKGGIYDHIGGGFHRYSVDRAWLIPHFEKMLYDNALLAKVYLEAYQLTRDRVFANIAKETLNWIIREMRGSAGGFYSAIDAESEGMEGNYYLWDPYEVISVLGEEQGRMVCRYYGITSEGNFQKGKTVLHIAQKDGLTKELEMIIHDARKKLLEARNQRERPVVDDKVITGWNGLAISALSYGFEVLHDTNYLKMAEAAASFIINHLKKRGRLLRYYRRGSANVEGMLDDYAYFVASLIDLYEGSAKSYWLQEALSLNSMMVELFWDEEQGGFFSTRSEENIVRVKTAHDEALPSPNSIAAFNLLRFWGLTGESRLREMAIKTFKAFGKNIVEAPALHCQMLSAMDFYLRGAKLIVFASP